MSQITKPANLSLIWASAGDILNPGDTKYQTGWQVELPPRQWENYIQNKQDQAIAHFNQHGIPVWDNQTEYQADKSYVQGSDGIVYRSIQLNTNQDPTLDVGNVYWKVAFSPNDYATELVTGPVKLAGQADAENASDSTLAMSPLRVLQQIRSITANATEALRGVLRVGTQAEVGAGTLDNVAVTPKKLRNGFAAVLATNGYLALPSWLGGFILQWQYVSSSAANNTPITFPITFPSACYHIQVTDNASTAGNVHMVSVDSATLTNSGVTLRTSDVAGFGNAYVFTIGR